MALQKENASPLMSERHLIRRERQIMDIVFRLAQASVMDIQAELPEPLTDAAILRMLSTLEEKSICAAGSMVEK